MKFIGVKEKNDEGNIKLEIEETEIKSKNKILKIGDIIYFKYIIDVSAKRENIKDSKSSIQTTIMSGLFLLSALNINFFFLIIGDGIANNKLECIPRISRDPKNASFLFRKCL